ncbi:MAG TPA: Smr/MutS family protein [Burkholderiales bacterium]|nr:Smr/MutS family protein [Burkholderiales bacterium]
MGKDEFDNELRLFREAVRDAVPLRVEPRHRPVPRKPAPVPVQRLLDDREALRASQEADFDDDEPPETGQSESYLAPGIGRDVLRKLRRGAWRVERELDLHGLTKEGARVEVAAFLQECVKQRWRCVRIVHGKGLGSRDRVPVLKGRVRVWLTKRAEVLAYCEPPEARGGGGALLVLLKG